MRPQERLAYIDCDHAVGDHGYVLVAADPPNPWIFCVIGGGALLCVGIILARRRAGHYD